MKKGKKLLAIVSILFCSTLTFAQNKPFSEWDATAFCSHTRYHPFQYIRADNNWEILQALPTWHSRSYLDSLGIRNTDSQMMLLRIEGLLEWDRDARLWRSSIPLLDSLQTVAARDYSKRIAEQIYPDIREDCRQLVDDLHRNKQSDHAYSILFSYVLDGEIWDEFHSYEEIKSSATWDGECWAFYFPRAFKCGTNTYDDTFVLNWTDLQPEFVGHELDGSDFVSPFVDEYNEHGKIVSSGLLKKAEELGIVHPDGSLRVPVIDRADDSSELNRLAGSIVGKISGRFLQSDFVPVFQEKFNITGDKLAVTMLYHEVMWDLMDLLVSDEIIRLPEIWTDPDPEKHLVGTVVYLKK